MTTYARVDADHTVREIIEVDGETADILSEELIAQLVPVPSGLTPAEGWRVEGTTFLPPAPPTKEALAAYAALRQVAIRDGGIRVDVGTEEAPLHADVASDASGRGLVTGCVQLVTLAQQTSQPAPSFPWVNDDGTQLTLSAAQVLKIALALGTFVQGTYAALGAIGAAITAGTIETYADIDAYA